MVSLLMHIWVTWPQLIKTIKGFYIYYIYKLSHQDQYIQKPDLTLDNKKSPGAARFPVGQLEIYYCFSRIWLDMQPLKLQRAIRIWWQGCPLGPKILHYVVWIDHVFVSGAVGLPVALRAAPRLATPRVGGGASNHSSWHKNVVNFHSTMII